MTFQVSFIYHLPHSVKLLRRVWGYVTVLPAIRTQQAIREGVGSVAVVDVHLQAPRAVSNTTATPLGANLLVVVNPSVLFRLPPQHHNHQHQKPLQHLRQNH